MKSIWSIFTIAVLAIAGTSCSQPNRVVSPDVRAAPPAPIVYECQDTHPASSPIVVSAAPGERCEVPTLNEIAALLQQSLADPPPTLPRVNATFTSMVVMPPVRVFYLADRFDPEMARMLAEVMDDGVIDKEATTLVIRDAEGNLLTQVSHRRVEGSPQAGTPSKMFLHNAYLVNSNGGLALDVLGNPIPADGAVVIGHVEVANACAAQNKRPIAALIHKLQTTIN